MFCKVNPTLPFCYGTSSFVLKMEIEDTEKTEDGRQKNKKEEETQLASPAASITGYITKESKVKQSFTKNAKSYYEERW